ncbi:MAG: T9SS type A sorting domain-containing protein [Candidatus Kapaibacterium sp.]
MNIRSTLSICFILLLLPLSLRAQYTGTASVTQGRATTTITNLYTCAGGRIAGVGMITATDKTVWTMPAVVSYSITTFPFASDLNNPCNGANYSTAAQALAKLNGSDIVTIDPSGEVITAYVFADNYFEMYINGVAVGKDNVPFTQFNSNIVRFRVKRPFTIAMKLVDWEENLGLGSESNGGFAYHPGDGGMVAVFTDATGEIVAITDKTWKAQTFYTSPITDLSCPTEQGALRLSDKCSTQNSQDGSKYYALHWVVPEGWMNPGFQDADWPSASTYSNESIGVNNKPAYTNFTSIFDDPKKDAQFIWSSNVILDNEVIVRYTVPSASEVEENTPSTNDTYLYPNPATNQCHISGRRGARLLRIVDVLGTVVYSTAEVQDVMTVEGLPAGVYSVVLDFSDYAVVRKLIVR